MVDGMALRSFQRIEQVTTTTLLHYYMTTLLHYYTTTLLHDYVTTLLHY
jgi:hypothetical protein